ncbi:MAG: hypothetical protein EA381_16870 [Planctomycetaceae bacterium]|nr:MAG: hypothetical protein EA381_16870 [Planctomycetaceae bacterium]
MQIPVQNSQTCPSFVGATALNAALAIVYLRDERAPRLVQYIREQSPAWFFDSFEHRLRRFVKSMGGGNEGYEPRDPRLMQTVEFIRELECAALQG